MNAQTQNITPNTLFNRKLRRRPPLRNGAPAPPMIGTVMDLARLLGHAPLIFADPAMVGFIGASTGRQIRCHQTVSSSNNP